ncbi:MAG: ATP-binding protein [Myxococcota bacterium]
MAWLDERVIALFRPRGREVTEAEMSLARFVIRAWLWTTPLILLLLMMYVANGLRFQAANQIATIGAGMALLLSYRLGAPLDLLRTGSLVVMALTFAAAALGQTPWDISSLFFLTLVPVAASFLGGFGWGVRWASFSAALGLVTVALGQHGVSFPDVDPSPTATLTTNFLFQMVLGMVLARTWADERERALVKVQAADRAKSIFLANVSHEIRTPMNGILGMTELLLKDELSADQRGQLEVVQRSGHALVLLINDLLDLARLEEGRFELVVAPFELRALLNDLVKLYSPLATERGLTLTLELDADLPARVRGDALRVRQVLSNLLSNAVKFTSRGTVRLTARREGAAVRFSVEDTGTGIPEALRSRLFQRFEQGDAAATRRTGGTGLGLALSHDFVARMGGTLALDEAYTGGARFTFALPLPVDDAAPARVEPTTPTALTGRVLVVDDNPINLAVARGLLTRAGLEVHTATNGRDAVREAGEHAWSLVLMDLQMPEMDGLEATRLIRQLPGAAARVPIVALTASAMPEDVEACQAAGMNDVLPKPIDVRHLAVLLQRYGSPPRER